MYDVSCMTGETKKKLYCVPKSYFRSRAIKKSLLCDTYVIILIIQSMGYVLGECWPTFVAIARRLRPIESLRMQLTVWQVQRFSNVKCVFKQLISDNSYVLTVTLIMQYNLRHLDVTCIVPYLGIIKIVRYFSKFKSYIL